MTSPSLAFRKCESLDDISACFALQKEVWRFSDVELVPVRLFVLAGKIGGQVMGAFDGPDLVGFALAIPGYRGGHPYLHSHMLAVRDDHRNSGVGRRLKLFQRDDALARGFALMEWTFDPLEIKNAYLNLEKLGAIARRYNINQYGITTSPLQGGLPTDRLVAEWWMNSERVSRLLTASPSPPFDPEAEIVVPAEVSAWKSSAETKPRAAQVQNAIRSQFLDAFSRGLAALGYQRDQHGNGKFLLGHWSENLAYEGGDHPA